MQTNPNLIVYQTFHKPFIRNHEVRWIQPIGVNGYIDDGMISDSYGINISHLNPYYCELTAIYWAWKNSKSDYVGLYHYRRYLNYCFDESWKDGFAFSVPSDNNIINYLTSDVQFQTVMHLMNSFDLIIPKKYASVLTTSEHYKTNHIAEHWELFISLLKTKYPDEPELIDTFEITNCTTVYNMFIMRRPVFESYCKELFELLNPIFWEFGSKYDSYNNRYVGFLAERFLGFWIDKNKLRYFEVPMLMIN